METVSQLERGIEREQSRYRRAMLSVGKSPALSLWRAFQEPVALGEKGREREREFLKRVGDCFRSLPFWDQVMLERSIIHPQCYYPFWYLYYLDEEGYRKERKRVYGAFLGAVHP